MTDLSALRGLRGAIPRVVLVARYVGGDRQDPIAFWSGSDRTEGVALRYSSDGRGPAIGREVPDEADLDRYGRVEVFEEPSWLGGGDELRISSEPGNELAEASHVAI